MAGSTPTGWSPQSDQLTWSDGRWVAASSGSISYPDGGNDACLAVEDSSYWFRHRANCLIGLLARFRFDGVFLDIGGGNGQMAAALQRDGREVVLLEPGAGATHALRRGVRHVIQATFAGAGLAPASFDAAGAFDVLEHIGDETGFLQEIRRVLRPGGWFYCTVPACQWLWSADDVAAGHHRRYSGPALRRSLQAAGFQVEYLTPIFSWLVVPVFLARALPSRLGLRSTAKAVSNSTVRSDHTLPVALQPLVASIHGWEARRVAAGRRMPIGTSLLCVARSQGS